MPYKEETYPHKRTNYEDQIKRGNGNAATFLFDETPNEYRTR
jgi:hypothetical protein